MQYDFKEISRYRQEEIKLCVELINDIWKENAQTNEYFRGMVKMFERILLLPKSLCHNKDELEYIENMIDKEFAQVSIDLLREAVRD